MAQSTAESPARFEDLNLSPAMLAAVAAAEYTHPTPIQAGLIPRALAGVDVLGQARTGTGKTAAFTIPILEAIEIGKKHTGAQALVLVPTRELAVQVREEVVKLSHGRKIHSVAIYGGKPIKGQIDKLRRGAEVVIGTPGRVLDHLARGTLELRDLKIVVLDEADRMLDIGFRPDIEKILRRCPQSRQTLLLSATVPPPVERLSKRYMRDPETLNFSPKDVSVETIEQFYFTVDGTRKFELLEKLLEREQPRQAIVFCRTKRGTDKIYQRLTKKLKDVAAIHGDLAQGARDRVMAGFRAGTVRYLVATDVVGRGIDVTNISHIINYDIPQFCDDYVHRVGRTGRMGREGVAYTFVSPEEGNELTRIEMRINLLLKRGEMPGFSASEPLATPAATNGPPRVRAEGEPERAEEAPAPAPPAAKPSGRKYRRAL
jgi:ATP-dependent RNA helicase DeaD